MPVRTVVLPEFLVPATPSSACLVPPTLSRLLARRAPERLAMAFASCPPPLRGRRALTPAQSGRTTSTCAAPPPQGAPLTRRAALSVAAAGLVAVGAAAAPRPAAAYSSRTQNDLSNASPTRYDGSKEVKTESGMRYLDLSLGEGADEELLPLVDGDRVTIYFTSRLWGYNGIVLDSTNDHKRDGLAEPFVFTMGDAAVVPGLQEMIRTMRVGGKRRAVLPPSIGYQTATMKPTPVDFPSMRRLRSVLETSRDATIVFDVELLKVKRAPGRGA
ncbi:hypothetical protein BU14_0031s0058 [Porphyra umbilicalis]|uniref:peptidylprolyl isomerase n=1 Tax=Porphyra umbilicalis TaxID=2786 RepID=A0A1X6PJG1_PORUM|nr:hypothetical protein BU14_0031s0058 [Porphyra umbilicalis]|eukprot:OSX80886.1 hypothetical protein BU14_0031s0058 [Porphyra umbilicalis]